MDPPDMSDAFTGGITLMLKLFGLILVLMIGLGVLANYIPTLAGFFGVLLVICLPAMLIRFAQNEEVFEAANPIAALQLILAIGLPYGLMLAFIVIMMGSMGILYELVGAHFGIVSVALQSLIGNYYLVVIFHLPGYMLFQYQDQLGYTARLQGDQEPRSMEDNLLAKASVLLKEGELDKMVDTYNHGFAKYPQDTRFGERYLEFLYKTKHARLMADFADRYLKRNTQQRVSDSLDLAYKKIKQVCPNYVPTSAAVRHNLAMRFHHKGDHISAARLLSALHKKRQKTDADYPKLIEAYRVLIECLKHIPNSESKISAVERFISEHEHRLVKDDRKPEQEEKTKDRPNDELPPIDFR